MKKFLYVLQLFLKLSLIFLIIFIWLRFILNSIVFALLIALGATLLIEVLHRLIKRKNKNYENLKLKEKTEADNMFLSLLTDKNHLLFFQNMFNTRHNNVLNKKKYLLINRDEGKTFFIPFLKLENISPDNIIEILKSINPNENDKITIVCYDFDKDSIAFTKNFKHDIVLINRFECYSLFKDYEFFPEITEEYKKEAKLNFKDLMAYAFNSSRTKGYLISSLILFITSFFVKLNVYYCIISSLLLLFALISFINPKYNKKKIKDII